MPKILHSLLPKSLHFWLPFTTGLTRAQIHIAHKVLCVSEGRFGAASGENVAFYDSFQSNKEAGRYLEDTSRHRALVFK